MGCLGLVGTQWGGAGPGALQAPPALWALWLPGLLAPPLQLLLQTQHVPPRTLGHSVVRVQQTAQPRAPSLSPLSARSPPWAPFLACSVATPTRNTWPRPGPHRRPCWPGPLECEAALRKSLFICTV